MTDPVHTDRKPYDVVVTGAGGGLGSQAVVQLLARGARVVAVDRDAELLAQLEHPVDAGELHTLVADVSTIDGVRSYIDLAVSLWGGVDGAFHIAGHEGAMPEFCEAELDEFDRMIDINARSVWYGMKLAIPLMIERGGGSVVNVGSHVAHRGTPRTCAYGAAKHAVAGMTKSVAIELARQNIRANMIAPGSMDTRMIRTLWKNTAPEDAAKGMAMTLSRVPNGRLGDPAEVAAVGVWLLLDAPTHLTGQVIPVDGGRSI
jgi:NAD(P)-dependent dehydrogenase (short-subunit alcohol dehydrogenase family)